MNERDSLEPGSAPPEDTDLRYGHKYVPAEIRERAAAFLIDVALLAVLGFAAAHVMSYLTRSGWNGLPHLSRFHLRLLLGAMGLVSFLYFFILEGAIGTTLGKFLCRLRLTTKRGDFPSLVAVAIRNVTRLVELILAPLLTFPVMEWSGFRQRPTDMILGTVVVRRLPAQAEGPSEDLQFASATGRAIASTLDAFFIYLLAVAVLLNISPDRRLVSIVILNGLPIAIVLYKLILTAICKSNLFAWFFGYHLADEEGGSVPFSGVLLRTVFLPLDLIFGGYLFMLLSTRRQRLGDFAGGTTMIRGRTSWIRGIIPLALTVLLTAGLGYLGLMNKGSFLNAPITLNFLDRLTVTFPDPRIVTDILKLLKGL